MTVFSASECTVYPWASYQIRKIAGCACAGNAGNVILRRWFQRKLLVSDHGMHHGTCVTHVPWCMSGSLTCGDGENVPGIPGACAPAILRIWQEAHWGQMIHTCFSGLGNSLLHDQLLICLWIKFISNELVTFHMPMSQLSHHLMHRLINCDDISRTETEWVRHGLDM